MFFFLLDRQCLAISFTATHGRYVIDFVKVVLNFQNTETIVIMIAIWEILLKALQFSSVALPAEGVTHPRGWCRETYL
jgi:hypothetical protein